MNQRKISNTSTILNALKIMDSTGFRSLLVLGDSDRFAGVLSIGDIQRAILKNIPFDQSVQQILRKNPKVAIKETSLSEVQSLMMKYRMEFLPVVDEQKHVLDIYLWEDVFGVEQLRPVTLFDLPVVVMAGGVGTRLKPLTSVLPKPLIPVNEKTMLEEIFQRFSRYGCNRFYLSLNYKADLIEYYLNGLNLQYELEFFREEKPMGTAGSLSLLKDRINETFFVTNCDILIEEDYSEILQYHRDNGNVITLVAALKHYPIPYGVLETAENGMLKSLEEKPEFTLKVNSGMYILESSVLDQIPSGTFIHITQLVEKIHRSGSKVGVFPVSERSWKDIGDWNEYKNHLI